MSPRKRSAAVEAVAPGPVEDMRIEYTPVSAILAWPRNPKKHDAEELDASIERFGFNDPPTVDETTGHLVEGHGRIEALERRRQRGGAPPARVRIDEGGGWLVPIVRGVRFKDEMEAEAYVVAHNRVGEGLWDNAVLAEVLASAREVSLVGIGYDSKEAEKIIQSSARADILDGDDDLPEVPRVAVAKKGEVWILGEHRLICGDSADPAALDKLLGEHGRADFLFSSPPYNVGIKYGEHNDKTVPWDQYGEFLRRVITNWQARLPAGRAIGWNIGATPQCYPAQQILLFEQLGWQVHRTMVWSKTGVSKPLWQTTKNPSVTRRFTPHYTFEYVHVFKRDELEPGELTAFDDTLSRDVFTMSPSEGAKDRDAKKEKHPAPFPVRLPLSFLVHFADKGAIVADCFNGSGTTCIAAERAGRRYVGVELDPKYVDVTIERWERISGGKARRA